MPGSIHHVNDVRWTQGGREVDIEEGPNWQKQRAGTSIRALYRSFGLQTLAWSKLLVLTSKKLTFKSSMYIIEYRPLPHYVHFTSVHSRDECSQAFPIFYRSSASVYYIERKQKVKTGEAWSEATVETRPHLADCVCGNIAVKCHLLGSSHFREIFSLT